MKMHALFLAAGLALAGCGHGHEHRAEAAPLAGSPDARLELVRRDAAASLLLDIDKLVQTGGAALADRGLVGAIDAGDRALEALASAARARTVAARARVLASQFTPDDGAAWDAANRAKGAAEMVERLAAITVEDAAKVAKARRPSPVLEDDKTALRAALRALEVYIVLLERSVE